MQGGGGHKTAPRPKLPQRGEQLEKTGRLGGSGIGRQNAAGRASSELLFQIASTPPR